FGRVVVKVVVFGATGETGRLLSERTLWAGHTVTAFVRGPTRMPIVHDRLRVVRATSSTLLRLIERFPATMQSYRLWGARRALRRRFFPTACGTSSMRWNGLAFGGSWSSRWPARWENRPDSQAGMRDCGTSVCCFQ